MHQTPKHSSPAIQEGGETLLASLKDTFRSTQSGEVPGPEDWGTRFALKEGHLRLSGPQMRQMGYRAIDLLVTHWETLKEKPVSRKANRPQLEGKLRESLPQQGSPFEKVLQQLSQEVFTHMMHLDHPRFFAWVASPSNFVSVLGDLLASGFNVHSGLWATASGPAQLELITLDWLKELLGYPATGGGLFLSGGSVANLTALTVARTIRIKEADRGRAVVYFSDQTHSSVLRAVNVLGFGTHQVRKLKSDAHFQLDVDLLAKAIGQDRRAGLLPFCVVANAGTTNTGAVDPLPVLYELCRQEGLWLHADGAYGAAARLDRLGRERLLGLELVDSLTVDPHKWLFQPYEMGCLLVKEPEWLTRTFQLVPEYLEDACTNPEEVDFAQQGIQLTRGFRALKLWLSLKAFGAPAFREAVSQGLALARLAEQHVHTLPGWEVVSPAVLSTITFRYAPAHLCEATREAVNLRVVQQMVKENYAMVATTRLAGVLVIRMCFVNPNTTAGEVINTLSRISTLADQALAPASPVQRYR